jgi:hypothetical protein
MPGDFRWTCGDYARVFVFIAHEAAGALGTRHSPRPLLGGRFLHHSGASHREIAELCVFCCLTIESALYDSSCLGLTRASTSYGIPENEDVDGRDKPGHDGLSERSVVGWTAQHAHQLKQLLRGTSLIHRSEL